jgi:hypothetical protein
LAPSAEISAVTDYEAYFRDEDDKVTDGNGKSSHKFTLIRFRDIKLGTDPAYLVQGLIPREGLVVIWGSPKCGKTFWAYDLLMHVALNWTYRDRRVEAGTVIYVACEGERGLAARSEAFRRAKLNDEADPPFYLLTTRLDLAAEVDQLAFDIAAQIPPEPCAAIVIDTLNRSIRGSESKDEDMSAYIAAADAMRERFKCAVIIIHHCGVNDSRPRGHTSLTGAVDTQIAVKRDTAGQIIATLEWMKDGPEGDAIVSRLRVIELGENDTGETISSCIIEPSDTEPSAAKTTLSPAQKQALDLLTEAINKAGEPPPTSDHIPRAVRCVNIALWREYCDRGSIANSDKPDSKLKAFKRSADGLMAARKVGKWGDQVWVVP